MSAFHFVFIVWQVCVRRDHLPGGSCQGCQGHGVNGDQRPAAPGQIGRRQGQEGTQGRRGILPAKVSSVHSLWLILGLWLVRVFRIEIENNCKSYLTFIYIQISKHQFEF